MFCPIYFFSSLSRGVLSSGSHFSTPFTFMSVTIFIMVSRTVCTISLLHSFSQYNFSPIMIFPQLAFSISHIRTSSLALPTSYTLPSLRGLGSSPKVLCTFRLVLYPSHSSHIFIGGAVRYCLGVFCPTPCFFSNPFSQVHFG